MIKHNGIWGNTQMAPPTDDAPSDKTVEIYKEPSYVERISNRIYFYSEINREQVLQLNKNLRETANNMLFESLAECRPPAEIFLHINSFGGSIFAGLSAMDEIISCKVPVTTVVDGCCASAATFLSIVGKRRIIRPNAFMLIHQLSTVFWGKFREIQDEMINAQKLMEMIKKAYKQYTKVPLDKIDEILDHDIWFDAEKCLEFGLVDEIL